MEVPALIDGAARIFDSTIILEYLEDKWPTPPLLPRDPASRAEARMIEDDHPIERRHAVLAIIKDQ